MVSAKCFFPKPVKEEGCRGLPVKRVLTGSPLRRERKPIQSAIWAYEKKAYEIGEAIL